MEHHLGIIIFILIAHAFELTNYAKYLMTFVVIAALSSDYAVARC